jgi:UDP-glucose 4-epimerase
VRDLVYVDDVADAFLRAGATDAVNGDVFNVGGAEPISHRDLVTILLDEAGRGSMRLIDWPEDIKRIDIGSFYCDSSKFERATGWKPQVNLRDGFRRTLAYYHDHLAQYVSEPSDAPVIT